jgi:hypothetical protein
MLDIPRVRWFPARPLGHRQGLQETRVDDIEPKGAVCGAAAKVISVGGIPIRIVSGHAGFWHHADLRYRNFYVSDDVEPQEEVEILVRSSDDAAGLPDGSEGTIIEVSEDALHMVRGKARGVWHRARRHAQLEQRASEFDGSCKVPDYAGASLVQVILCHHLLERGALLVHSSAVAVEDRGYLFVGRSGAGKSTTAMLSEGIGRVFADDVNIASAGDDVTGPTVSGTPYCGALKPGGLNETAPLKAVYVLKQADRNKRSRLSRSESIRRMLESVVLFDESPAAAKAALENTAELCERVPCYELEFLKNPSFWSCADA